MRRRPNPGPLIAAAAAFPWISATVGTALIALGLYEKGKEEKREYEEEKEYWDWRLALEPPTRPPAPPAPQTREELTRWTPADLERQAALEWARWRREAIPETPPEGPPAKEPDLWIWLGAAAAALGLILVVKQ